MNDDAASVAASGAGLSNIRNIIFDIGNVVVRWSPALIVERAFGPEKGTADFAAQLFGAPIWMAINRGELTEAEAKRDYCKGFGLTPDETDAMFFHIKDSQELVPGTIDVMEKLASRGYRLFALTDNVHEIVAYLKQRYDFWKHFEGAAVSAELGMMKPSAEIYRYLLDTYGLAGEETLFLDDVEANVMGARNVGMKSFQFTSAEQAVADMRGIDILID